MTQSKEDTMYNETIITRKVRLPYTAVGANLEENLYTMIYSGWDHEDINVFCRIANSQRH
jgi:hypothetical protein